MKYDLSIIIPCYNSKNTINETLNSIKIQITNFTYEVILVNDCSNYNYDTFISYYSKYFNIREINTNKNIGPGGARRLGINNSNSFYITFIDSDDVFYNSKSLQDMFTNIKNNNSDLLIGNFKYIRDNTTQINKKNLVWLHGKMYKREFLEKYNITFNDSRANEDNGFNRLILLMNPKIFYLNKTVYVYNDNPNSITRINNRNYKFSGLEGFCFNMNWAMEEAIKRNVDYLDIFILANDILISLYIYYNSLYKDNDISKIYKWASKIKEKSNIVFNDYLDELILNKRNQLSYEVQFNDYIISFKDFYNNIINN